jgi:uncharacterized protein
MRLPRCVRGCTDTHLLFRGKVSGVWRRNDAGFAKGGPEVEGLDPCAGSALELRFQNEHLVAIRYGRVVASVPDLIIALDAEGGDPITSEEVRYGYRAVVLGERCDARWRTPQGLAVVGSRYFGYDFDCKPFEEQIAAGTVA